MATKKAATVETDASPSLQPATRQRPALPASTDSKRASRKPARSRPFRRIAGKRTPMRTDCRLASSEPLARHLSRCVIGQEDAIEALVCSWARALSGLRDPGRPLLTSMLLGPTGVGKTETARALAEALFGSALALHRINCEEYAHGHEVAKLLGSPPGYVGGDIEPLLSQQRIDAPHKQLREAREGEAAGTHPALGARPLRRALERMIVGPVSRLLASTQIAAGDVVEVELDDGALTFYRWPRSADSIVA